jgi:1,4-dihydroxy-2-naphthoate octaprenyltransferase
MASVVGNWAEVLRTQNLSPGRHMDPVSRWLLITRASVFPMTLTSGILGGLLAVAGPTPAPFHALLFVEALVGLVLAHAANNMINDWFDLAAGVDSNEYVRGQYAPHPILSGLVSKRGLVAAIAAVNLADLAILVHLASVRGWPVVAFALAGLFISVFYVAPPLKLKHRGLGEPGVFLVWGPLMIGGTYYVATGLLPAWIWAASLPYALLVMTVLFGKHIDKLEADAAKGIRTLPVILGEARSRVATQAIMLAFFAAVGALVLTGTFGVWTLAVFAAVPRLRAVLRVFGQPRPAAPPPGYPIWPLWYVAWAFMLTRLAGILLALGLIANAILPLHL